MALPNSNKFYKCFEWHNTKLQPLLATYYNIVYNSVAILLASKNKREMKDKGVT